MEQILRSVLTEAWTRLLTAFHPVRAGRVAIVTALLSPRRAGMARPAVLLSGS